MERPEQPKTPNLDRVRKLANVTHGTVEFLAWVSNQRGGKALIKRVLAAKRTTDVQALLDAWLARFYGVDLDAVAAEQKANVQWAADMMTYLLQQDAERKP